MPVVDSKRGEVHRKEPFSKSIRELGTTQPKKKGREFKNGHASLMTRGHGFLEKTSGRGGKQGKSVCKRIGDFRGGRVPEEGVSKLNFGQERERRRRKMIYFKRAKKGGSKYQEGGEKKKWKKKDVLTKMRTRHWQRSSTVGLKQVLFYRSKNRGRG